MRLLVLIYSMLTFSTTAYAQASVDEVPPSCALVWVGAAMQQGLAGREDVARREFEHGEAVLWVGKNGGFGLAITDEGWAVHKYRYAGRCMVDPAGNVMRNVWVRDYPRTEA